MPTNPNMNAKTKREDDLVREEDIAELAKAFDVEEPEIEQEIIENEDGSVTVNIEDIKTPQDDPEFYANLAEELPEAFLDKLAMDYLEYIEIDRESRKKRDQQYEEGLRRSGLGKDAPGGATFEGASKVVHPVIAEACIDFSASTCKELLPADGIVKSALYGNDKSDMAQAADRKTRFMNWQLDHQIPEYRDEMEQMITQIPMGGNQYLKWRFDKDRRRPMTEWIPIDNIFLPFECTNFYDAARVTEIQDISEDTLMSRIDDGTYRDVEGLDLITPDLASMERSASAAANDKIEGKQEPEQNIDGIRRVFEVTAFLRVEDDPESEGRRASYIFTIDEQSRKVLSMRRNWEQGDDKLEKLDWMVEFKFIPWRGAYAIGLPHLIGGLSAALTGSLRALLDSAHISNSQTLVKLKGGRMSGQSDRIEPTQILEIEAGVGIDDIRKIMMPMNFPGPSNVLYNLLDWLTNAAKGVVSTAEEKIGDVNSNSPVGTTQALIEQGSKIASSIHARLHRSQAKSLQILQRINHWYLEDMDNQSGTDIEVRDFAYTSNVIPVSDPNIFSETQRLAQDQAVLAMATQFPQMYDLRKVNERILKRMKIPQINDILPDPKGVVESNPALENVSMTMGKPAAAFPDQDHVAHLKVHLAYALDPNYGGNPLIGPGLMPHLMEHIKQHLAMDYLMSMKGYVSGAAGGEDVFKLHEEQPLDREAQQALAVAAQLVNADAQTKLAPFQQPIMGLVQKMTESAKAQQEQIQDPSAKAILQAQMAETQRKTQEMQAKFQLDGQKMQMDYEQKMQDMQAKLVELQQKFRAENDKLSNQIALANINNSAKERLEMIKAGIAFDQAQMQMEHEQNQNAVMAQNQADQAYAQHQLELERGEAEAQRAAQEAESQRQFQAQAEQFKAKQGQQSAEMAHKQKLEQTQQQQHHQAIMADREQTLAQQTQQAQAQQAEQQQLNEQMHEFHMGGITREDSVDDRDTERKFAEKDSNVNHERSKETMQMQHQHSMEALKAKTQPKPAVKAKTAKRTPK